MNLSFATLFQLSVTHEFLGGTTPSLRVLPTAGSARSLRRGRLLSSQRGDVHRVLFEADESGQPVVSLAGEGLRLGLQLTDRGLLNVTATDWQMGREAARFVTSADGSALVRAGTLPLERGQLEDELLREGVQVVLDLTIAEAWYTAPPALSVTLQARHERLRVYVVAQGFSQAELATLSLVDEKASDDDRPAISFETVSAADFSAEEAPAATLAADGAPLVLFRSSAPVARRKRARKGLRLLRGSEPILTDIPQPSAARARADVVIRLSRPDS